MKKQKFNKFLKGEDENMKVVLISNFNLETVNDVLLEGNLSEEEAKIKTDEWNDKNPNSDYYAVMKEDDYRLHKFDPMA